MNNKLIKIIFIFFLIILFVFQSNSFVTETTITTIYVSNLNSKTYSGINCGDSINIPCINLNDAFEKLKSLVSQNNSIVEIEIEILNNKHNKEYKPSKLEIVNENFSFSINGGKESTIIDFTDFQDSFINIIKPTTTTESIINKNNNNNKFNFTNLTFKRNLNFSSPSSTIIRPTLFNIVNIKSLLFNNIEIILNNNTISGSGSGRDNSIIQETAFFNFTNSNVKFSDCSIPSNKPIIGTNSTIEINFSNFTLNPNNLNSCYPCQYKIIQSNDINDNNNKNNNNNNKNNTNTEYKENLIILTITISFSIIIVITATYKLYNKYRLYKIVNLSIANNNNNNNNNATTATKTGGISGINLLKNIIPKKTNSDYIKLEAIKSGDTINSINSE
ncbi:hypothetical protein ACTFIU_001643 [Dictyostelium citrinum]